MGAIRIASTALLGAAALSFAAPTAATAADGSSNATNIPPFGFSVTPSVVAPGGQVTLNVTNCPGNATVSSGIFDTITIPPESSRNATVDASAKRGASYTVTFTCNGTRGTAQLTITGGSPTTSSTVRPTVRPTATATSPLGVRGGLGGSVKESLDPVAMSVGATLVATAVGGAVYFLRRRRFDRRH
ncbi:hypothetical protein [Streptomyces sp. WM6378]|uniref:hypothetical protein n=1 Tax=Streptomyces sp. WM6378 TaxID=1415557 RepID=UPI0006AD9153|nr:hypothetical protein [Streptomyces sp. WM6378]KOU34070.1 hypothetical protein ADK54_40780 [Streptomyces sp. WM6378]